LSIEIRCNSDYNGLACFALDLKNKHMRKIIRILLLGGFIFHFGIVTTCAQITIGGYNVYYGSLHNHTGYSDGQGTPTQAYQYAREVGLQDFFGLSDHGELLSSTEWNNIKSAANAANQEGVYTTFYGFEWSSFWSYGHVSVFNTTDYCGYPAVGSFNSLLTWINSRNGIAFFNHPGYDNLAYTEFDHFTDPPSSKFVGIELWNDHDGFSTYYYNDGFYSNDGNKGYYDEALIRGWKIGASGSDDNHTATWGTATPMRMAVLAPANTRTDIMNALIARRFYSTIDKNLGLSFKINGFEMGSSVPAGNCNVVIEATDADNEIFTQIQLIKNGTVINTWLIYDAAPVYSYNLTSVNGDYYYTKVTQSDGNEAISSPVFITSPLNQPPIVQITSPVSGTNYNTGATVTITATASDPDGTINKVEFYSGATKLGEVTSPPYEFNWANVQNGNYTLTCTAFDNLGLSTNSTGVEITVSTPSLVIINQRISVGNDDAEEGKSGSVNLTNDDLELVYDTKTTGNQVVGLRFNNTGIPQGATITNAYIQFTVDERSTAGCNLKIEGETTGNSQAFTNAQYNVSQRPRTANNITWVPAGWKTVGASGTDQRTPDVKNILQEIVNRADYQSTGGLTFIITGTGKRVAESFEGSSSKAALLHVEYSSARSLSISNAAVTNQTACKPEDIKVIIYPNPANDFITVKLADDQVIDKIMCFNSSGQLISTYHLNSVGEFNIDCSEFKKGLYFIRIQSSNLQGVSKFVVK
jgi:hypothetical protein